MRRRRCGQIFPETPMQENAHLSRAHRRAHLPEARGSVAGPLLQDPRRLQFLPQGAGRRHRGRAVRLRLGRQPRAGLCLRVPAFRQEGRRVHAGDHAAAEDRQDPHLRRRVRRDQAGRRFLRRLLPRRDRFCRGERRPHGAAFRPQGHHRGAGDGRLRDIRPDAGRPHARHHGAAGRRRRAFGRRHALFPGAGARRRASSFASRPARRA